MYYYTFFENFFNKVISVNKVKKARVLSFKHNKKNLNSYYKNLKEK